MRCAALILAIVPVAGCSFLLDGGDGSTCSGDECELPPSPDIMLPPDFPPGVVADYPCVGKGFGEPLPMQVLADGRTQVGISDITVMEGESRILYRDNGLLWEATEPGVTLPGCNPDYPCFTTTEPLSITGFEDANLRSPKLSADATVMRFSADLGTGSKQVYQAARGSPSEPWPGAGIQGTYGAGNSVSPPYPGRVVEVYAVDGELRSLDLGEQDFLDIVDDVLPGNTDDPWISVDGRVLVVSAGEDLDDLYLLAREQVGLAWSEPLRFGDGINAGADVEDPWLSEDLCVVYFSSEPDVEDPDSVILRAERRAE